MRVPWAAPWSGILTVRATCERYLAQIRERKGTNAAGDAPSELNRHVLPALGEACVADLTTARIEDRLRSLVCGETDEARRKSRDTANRVLTALRAVLNAAFRADLVADAGAWRRVRSFQAVGRPARFS